MKKYSAFTLIEMLIVMGIIIILMAAGIAGGRFAIQRANQIQKQNAVENLEQALWGYYGDNRIFPDAPVGGGGTVPIPQNLINGVTGVDDYLIPYMDAAAFDGGQDGDFWYFVGGNSQEFVVCASLGGIGDNTEQGIFCSGNGLGSVDLTDSNGATFESQPSNIYPPGSTNHTNLIDNAGGKSLWQDGSFN